MKKYLLKAWLILVVSFVAVNVMGQESYSTGYPSITDITHESAILNVSASVGGLIKISNKPPVFISSHYTLFIVLESTKQAPSVQEVIEWIDDGNNGVIPEDMYGFIGLSSANAEYNFDISDLSPETSYTAYFVTVESDFETPVIETVEPTSVSFTTAAAVSGPEIITFSPTNGATDVSVNPTLIVEFDSNITLGNTGYFRILADGVEKAIYPTSSGQVAGNVLTINALALDHSTTYYVEIDPGFIENFGGLNDPTRWTFTTETKPPQWSAGFPTLTQSLTGFTFTGKTDLAGIYYFVVTNSSNKPTPAQIKAGKSAAGNAALKKFNDVMIADTEFSKPIVFDPELSIGQTYFLHAVAISSNGKDSDIETFTIDRRSEEHTSELQSR